MSDLPDFLSDEPSSEPIEPAADPSPPEPQAAPEPEAQPAPVEQPQPEPEPAPAEQPASIMVPLAAQLDERERRQAAERERDELRQWRQQQEARARAQPAPDALDDPQGALAYRDQQFQAALRDRDILFSERIAKVTHGSDTVKAAKDWYDKEGSRDPYLDQKVAASDDPYELVIAEWKHNQLLSRLAPEQIDAFQQWQASQAGNPAPGVPASAAPAQQAPARPTAPRPSIAAGPSAGGAGAPAPLDGEGTFQDMFGVK